MPALLDLGAIITVSAVAKLPESLSERFWDSFSWSASLFSPCYASAAGVVIAKLGVSSISLRHKEKVSDLLHIINPCQNKDTKCSQVAEWPACLLCKMIKARA